MQVHVLKSKIHRACVTAAHLDYEGSLSIDQDWMDQVGLIPFERILGSNLSNAARFETYAIPAPRGSRAIVLNGAVARLGQPGDRLTLMSFAEIDQSTTRDWQPRVIVLGDQNAVVNTRGI